METQKINVGLWLAAAIVVVSIACLVGLCGTGITVSIVGDTINQPASVQASADEKLVGGGSRFIDSYIYTGKGFFTDGADGYSLGTFGIDEFTGGATTTDGYTEKLLVINLNATSSAVAANPEGRTVYVYDATVRVQTATTTATAYQAGTTTASGVDQGNTCGVTGSCGDATAGHASILNTGTAAATTVGSTFFKADYQGTDTRDGSGTRYVVPVLSTDYFSCNASTTPSANKTTGGQAVQCQFKYYVIED